MTLFGKLAKALGLGLLHAPQATAGKAFGVTATSVGLSANHKNLDRQQTTVHGPGRNPTTNSTGNDSGVPMGVDRVNRSVGAQGGESIRPLPWQLGSDEQC
jgi:hypothetical protein